MTDLRETPLHDWHREHGGRMVPFAGWHLPVQYSGLVDEHTAVRERAGLFDVSHMGEIRVRGADALANLQRLLVNDASGLQPGQAQYTAMCREDGGILDDLLVYFVAPDDYLLVVNAGTTDKDRDWIAERVSGSVEVVDESADWAQLAVQGPAAPAIVAALFGEAADDLRYYRFEVLDYDRSEAIVSRTGYTGEDGFEVYVRPDRAAALADAIVAAGEPHGLLPAGLGARDTLRLEAGMLLYGTDMDESRSPIEARLGWIVKPDKGDFAGKDVLVRQRSEGTAERIVGLELDRRAIPRHGYPVLAADGERIGEVTSGTFSPTLQHGIGLAYVASPHAEPDRELQVEIRGRRHPVRTVKTPFYKRPR